VFFLLSVSNKWIHERGQEFRRPCGLSQEDREWTPPPTHTHTHTPALMPTTSLPRLDFMIEKYFMRQCYLGDWLENDVMMFINHQKQNQGLRHVSVSLFRWVKWPSAKSRLLPRLWELCCHGDQTVPHCTKVIKSLENTPCLARMSFIEFPLCEYLWPKQRFKNIKKCKRRRIFFLQAGFWEAELNKRFPYIDSTKSHFTIIQIWSSNQ